MKKKILCFLLTLVTLFSVFAVTGCDNGDGPGSSAEDRNKTKLYTVSFDGGWGIDWLKTMATEFEEMYKDYSFEEGKKGIKIEIKGGKSDVTGSSLEALMAESSDYDLFFSTFNLRDYNLNGKLRDITEIVTNTMDAKYAKVWSDLGETGSIEDKMDSTIKDYVKYANANGKGVVEEVKYFGIPMYSSFYNLNYDIDLFYENGYYMNDAGNFIPGTLDGNTEEQIDAAKHAGQDGVKGTEDDGLPITMADFEKLCRYMKDQDGVSPLCWSGNIVGYRSDYINTFWANYEGADDWYINVTGEGTDSEFGEISVEKQNGYKLAGQAGRKAALTFAEKIVRNGWYDTNASSGTSHTEAQNRFLNSKLNDTLGTGNRIAMMLEGGWWENEAKDTINTMTQYGDEYVNRRFGVMTYPRMDSGSYVDANGNNEMVLVSVTPYSNVGIKKSAKQVEAAELFLIYTTTEKCLRTYTRMTGSTRCYHYTLTDEDKAQMSNYKVSLWNYYERSIKSGNIRYIAGPGRFGQFNTGCVQSSFAVTITDVGGYNATDAFALFIYNTNVTANDYFNAYKSYYSEAKYKSTFLNQLLK